LEEVVRFFVVVPMPVQSQVNGQWRNISASDLVRLYGLRPSEYRVLSDFSITYPSTWPRLGPQRSGDYLHVERCSRCDWPVALHEFEDCWSEAGLCRAGEDQ
jgi:hypothetical protein